MLISRDPHLRTSLIAMLFDSMRGFHALASLAAVVLAWLHWGDGHKPALLAWLALMLACYALQGLNGMLYRRLGAGVAAVCFRGYAAVHLLVSAGWGAAIWLMPPPGEFWPSLTVGALLMSVISITLNQLGHAAPLFAVGAVLTGAPVVARLFWEAQGPVETMAAVLGVCAVGALIHAGFRHYRARIADLLTRESLEQAQAELVRERERLRHAEARIRLGETYDSLTETMSYAGFTQTLRERLSRGALVTLACVNIDGFTGINDAFGMYAGDFVLRAVADRLAEVAGSRELVGRVSADEFLVLSPEELNEHDAAAFPELLLQRLSVPIQLEDTSITLAVSIGVTRSAGIGMDPSDIIEGAILAMRAAKAETGSCYRWYRSSLRDQARGSLSLRLELSRALERNELELFFQPKIHLRSGRVVGAEALLRWHSHQLGWVTPSQFIPVAESSGLIVPIGDWVIDQAAAAVARLNEVAPLHVAVNVSMQQFGTGKLPERLAEALSRHQVAPEQLHVEITESTFMSNPTSVGRILRGIRELGLAVALDDFGTGFSSLSYLQHMNVDYLKLDRSFIAGIPSDHRQASIVRSVLELARALNMSVVAEGIEYEQQRLWLAQANCAVGQGYLFSRPMPEAAFRQWLLGYRPAVTG